MHFYLIHWRTFDNRKQGTTEICLEKPISTSEDFKQIVKKLPFEDSEIIAFSKFEEE